MSAPRCRAAARRRSRGITLVEAMIAVVLLSFGLIGMIGLKAAGLKATANSQSRSVAALHAQEMFDRLRANPVRARAGQYAIALDAAPPATPATVAQVDLVQWRAGIVQDLPAGTGSVQVQADGRAVVVVQWRERSSEAAEPQTLSFSFEGRL